MSDKKKLFGGELLAAARMGTVDEFEIAMRCVDEAVQKLRDSRVRELEKWDRAKWQIEWDAGADGRRLSDIMQLRAKEAKDKIAYAVKAREEAEQQCKQLETRCSRLSRELADAQTYARVAVYVAAVCLALGVWGWLV